MVERLGKHSTIRGMSRRSFLQWLGVGSGSALLAGCERGSGGMASGRGPTAAPWVKDPTPFIRHSTNLETRLETLHGLITPNDLFFVRNHAPTPEIDPATYRLRVEGDAVERPLELSYDDILDLPSHTLVAYVECAGNWRRFFAELLGRAAQGGQWGTGAVGCAEWTGTQLATVLELAGVKRSVVDVNLLGLDNGEFNRPMPIAKALDPDTLLVYAMNGDMLPPDHGFPLRAVVPGWVGSNSVKWVGRIVVSSEKLWVKNNTTSYVLVGPDWPAEQHAPADGGPITTQNIKSALALPWPAQLRAGRQRIRGFAYSPHAPIARVEWSDDDGNSWHRATVHDSGLRHAWSRFEFAWDAVPGSHTLTLRASDSKHNTQSATVPFNEKGYLLNIPLPHPVEVS